ncbi:MAG: tetratricopeptide repeat protein [Ignavibacteriaceae bacterium]
MNDLYDEAVIHFNRKDFFNAENILTRLIQNNQQDYDALNFLGIIKLNLEDYSSASYYFIQTISIYEQHSEAHYNLAYCYQKLNQLEEALYHYQKTLELNPQHINAKNNLAVIYQEQNKFEEAEMILRGLVDKYPGNAAAHNNLGNHFFKRSSFDEAIKFYQTAVNITPGKTDYQYNLGMCYIKMEYFSSAFQCFEKVLQLNPNHLFSLINLGIIATKLKSFEKAEKIFNDLLKSHENEPEVFFNLGFCFEEQEKYEKALDCYKKYLYLVPDSSPEATPAIIRSAYILSKLGLVEKARELYDKYLQNDELKELAFIELGNSKLRSGYAVDALRFFDNALKIRPEAVELHYAKAHCQLLLGDFKNGWEEYEWRIKKPEFSARSLKKPRLIDQDIRGKKILVYTEQGLGDTIQFVRYLPMLKEKGAYVIFECSDYLLMLLKDFPGYDQRINITGVSEDELDYDFQIPILSLPYYFKSGIESIPSKIPYIQVDKSKKEKWEKIIRHSEKLKIGIVWSGSPKHGGDRQRSCPLEKFQPVIDRNDVEVYSLQLGSGLNQLDEQKKIIDLKEYNTDLTEAAAAIANLDLIISVDTSIVHLAGALGKQVWVLLPMFPDWRWLLGRDDSPWYPTMKLYRQTRPYDFDEVFERINNDLDLFIQTKKNESNDKNCFIPSMNVKETSQIDEPLFLAMSKGENFGWGICSKYIKKELSKKMEVIDLYEGENSSNINIHGNVLHTIAGLDFNKIFDVNGKKNFGYTFFENELTNTSLENSKKYDLIFAGSSWCYEKMYDKGIKNCDVLLQGIDPEIFYPSEPMMNPDLFVIFSGGKFELRKGQDLVLKAVKVLQQKFKDVVLINAWYNTWPNSMASMRTSQHIKYVYQGKDWTQVMKSIYLVNGLDLNRIITLPLVRNEEMRGIYSQTNVGLFPNRCEGGTNLVLMEYMACGKPAIASFNTGHRDILNPGNALLLNEMKVLKGYDSNNNLISDWEEPNFDEIISKLEYAYFNRDEIKMTGQRAAQDMKSYTWEKTAENLLKKINAN